MNALYLLAPVLLLLAIFVAGFAVFTVLTLTGRPPVLREVKHNQLFGPFFGRFLIWLLTPIERVLVGRVSANAITACSLVLCVLAGLAAGTGHFVAATWTYALAGMLDALDGRVARQAGQQTPAGALFDSVADRWGELFMFTGYAWYVRETPWLLAVMAAAGGSMMVSYTRARAEGLGLNLTGGVMQRAERIVLITVGALIAAWCVVRPATAALAAPVVGVTMLLCGISSSATAVTRWIAAYRELARRAATPGAVVKPVATRPPRPLRKLRESAELGL